MDTMDQMNDALQDVSNASNDLSNGKSASELTSDESPPVDLRGLGWAEPTPFNYEITEKKDVNDWAGAAARYEWQDEYGDVGPRNEELEKILFHDELILRAGGKLEV